jgi:REP element-mobilizing transposase RayT
MARPLRIEYDGVLYHVTSRDNERKAIFRGDSDRELFPATLAPVTERFQWICHAYCLMDNHYYFQSHRALGDCKDSPTHYASMYQANRRSKRYRKVKDLSVARVWTGFFKKGGEKKKARDRAISDAVSKHGYSQIEIARHLKLHYSTVSGLIKSVEENRG